MEDTSQITQNETINNNNNNESNNSSNEQQIIEPPSNVNLQNTNNTYNINEQNQQIQTIPMQAGIQTVQPMTASEPIAQQQQQSYIAIPSIHGDLTQNTSVYYTNEDYLNLNQDYTQSRWSREARKNLAQLMQSLPNQDIGSAIRVIIDSYGLKNTKICRRGEMIEMDISQINDDFILDNLYEYCCNVSHNQQQMQLQQQYVNNNSNNINNNNMNMNTNTFITDNNNNNINNINNTITNNN